MFMKKIIIVVLVLFVNNLCRGQEHFGYKGENREMAISAYWYNCKTDTAVESAVKATIVMKSSLQIYGPVLADSFYVKAEVYLPKGKKAYSQSFFIKKGIKPKEFRYDAGNNCFLMNVPTYQLSENPEKIKITISSSDNKLERCVNCKYHKLYGHMTDFKGNSLKSYILIKASGFQNVSGTWSDDEGNYEICLPERTYNCFYVNDGNYKSTTLEAWAWNIIMDEDQKLDFKIGTGEVYNLNAWYNNGGGSTFFISFRPMVLFYNNSGDNKQEINHKTFNLIDISPDLDINDLTVTINGKKTDLYSLQKYFETGYPNQAMPAYQLRSNYGQITVKKHLIRYPLRLFNV